MLWFFNPHRNHRHILPFLEVVFSDFGAHRSTFCVLWSVFWKWRLIFRLWRKSFEEGADRNVSQKSNPFQHSHPKRKVVALEAGRCLTTVVGPSLPLDQTSFLWAPWKRTKGSLTSQQPSTTSPSLIILRHHSGRTCLKYNLVLKSDDCTISELLTLPGLQGPSGILVSFLHN